MVLTYPSPSFLTKACPPYMTSVHYPHQGFNAVINDIKSSTDPSQCHQVLHTLMSIHARLSFHVSTVILKCRQDIKLPCQRSSCSKTKHLNCLAPAEVQSNPVVKFRPDSTTESRAHPICIGTGREL